MAPDHSTHPLAGTTDGGALQRRFGDRWQIDYHDELRYWAADWTSRDGQHIRYLCARSAADLAGKLEAAETDEP